MIIEKIHIKSFGQLQDTVLEFSESVNVIEGQNEAGKSTIAAFIKYMLYGFDAGEDGDMLSERVRRINWDTGIAEGTMYVRVGDKRYLITRSTVRVQGQGRPTYKEENSIIDLETGAPAFGKAPAGEIFFKVNRELFENTAFIGEVGRTRIDEAGVCQSIENILFSGSEKLNLRRAESILSEKMHNLLRENGMGGAIYDLSLRRKELTDALEHANEDNQRILSKEAELHEIRERRRAADEKCAQYLDYDASYRNFMVIQTFDKLHELERECEGRAEAYNRFVEENAHNGFVPTQQYLTDIAVARRGVNDAYCAVQKAQEHYASEKNAIGITREIEGNIEKADEVGGEVAVRRQADNIHARQIKSIAGAVLGVLLLIAALVYEIVAGGRLAAVLPRTAVGIVGGLSLLAVAALGWVWFRDRKSLTALERKFETDKLSDLREKLTVIGEARSKRDTMIANTESARRAVEEAKQDYERSKAALSDLILQWSAEVPETELNAFLDELEARVTRFLDQQRALADEKSMSEITVKEIRRQLADKNEVDIRARVTPFKRKMMASINHDEIINGIADCRAQIAEQDRLADEVSGELSALKTRVRDPAELHTRIRALDDQIRELRARHKAYFVALDAISRASDNLRAEISPRLGEYTTRLMEIMTEKKYPRFDVDAGLKVTFSTPEGEQRSTDYLSDGTRDMTYIAVRMALVDMLYTEKPPVCYDETFAHQDNIRAKSLMRAVCALGQEGYQNIIFTCRRREATLAKELFPTATVFKLSVGDEGDL